jgi:predicted naringenin-chalcone synthase
MDSGSQFKVDGDLSLTVPLAQGFDKILHDCIRMIVSKSGFEAQSASQIASRITNLVLEKTRKAAQKAKKAHVEVFMSHGRGHVTIKTTIHELHFSKEETFQAKDC